MRSGPLKPPAVKSVYLCCSLSLIMSATAAGAQGMGRCRQRAANQLRPNSHKLHHPEAGRAGLGPVRRLSRCPPSGGDLGTTAVRTTDAGPFRLLAFRQFPSAKDHLHVLVKLQ
jgi:hypothetical protein